MWRKKAFIHQGLSSDSPAIDGHFDFAQIWYTEISVRGVRKCMFFGQALHIFQSRAKIGHFLTVYQIWAKSKGPSFAAESLLNP